MKELEGVLLMLTEPNESEIVSAMSVDMRAPTTPRIAQINGTLRVFPLIFLHVLGSYQTDDK